MNKLSFLFLFSILLLTSSYALKINENDIRGVVIQQQEFLPAGTSISFNSTYNNLLGQNCPVGFVVNGTQANGSLICTTDQTGTGSQNNTNIAFLNNSNIFTASNNTFINLTAFFLFGDGRNLINLRIFNITYNNLLGQNCPVGRVVNGTLANGTLICTTVTGGTQDNTNIAFTNWTNTFTESQTINKNLTVNATIYARRLIVNNSQVNTVVAGGDASNYAGIKVYGKSDGGYSNGAPLEIYGDTGRKLISFGGDGVPANYGNIYCFGDKNLAGGVLCDIMVADRSINSSDRRTMGFQIGYNYLETNHYTFAVASTGVGYPMVLRDDGYTCFGNGCSINSGYTVNVVDKVNTATAYAVAGVDGISDTTSYYMSSDPFSFTACGVQISGGIITGCV